MKRLQLLFLLLISLIAPIGLGLVAATIDFNSLTVGDRLVGQDGWSGINSGQGGTIQASTNIPNYGMAQAARTTFSAPAGQFAKENVASGMTSDGIFWMDVLVKHYNVCPISFAPAAGGFVVNGSSYIGPQFHFGRYGTENNQAFFKAGGADALDPPVGKTPQIALISDGDWVWFRLELDCSELAATGNVIASAHYQNLTNGDTRFRAIPAMTDISLSLAGMDPAAADPANWTGVWLQHQTLFNNPGIEGEIAAVALTQAPLDKIWETPFSNTIGLGNSHTSLTVDGDRIYTVVIAPDRSAHVFALDKNGNELSSSEILPAGGVVDDPHNSFSIGIDPLGYLHVTGNHHNDFFNYWISDTPRSAATFTDYSTLHDNNDPPNLLGSLWEDSKLGGRLITYPNFFRDNYGRLWLTARVQAKQFSLIAPLSDPPPATTQSATSDLRGLRGGLLSRYDPYNLKIWEHSGNQAPVEGNTWGVPVITWDETGRAASGTGLDTAEWYQAYRINLDFDSANNMHLAWITHGSVAEGTGYAEDTLSGATHFNYMLRQDSNGAFLDANGALVDLPASRWDTDLIYNNPGDFSFGTYVTTGAGDDPFFIYMRETGGAGSNIFTQYLRRYDSSTGWVDRVLPIQVPDVSRQVLYHSDVGLIVLDDQALWISPDRGDTWSSLSGSKLLGVKQLDKAFFRRTGNLLFANIDTDSSGDTNYRIAQINLNPAAVLPAPADDLDYTTTENTALAIAAPGILANDFHPQLDSVTPSLVAGPSDGLLTLNSDGSFTYQPNSGFTGQDGFTYESTDSFGNTAQATVTLTVQPALDGLMAYEPFDLSTGTLLNRSGSSSFGFEGGWQQATLDPAGSSLTVNPSTLISGSGNHLGQDADGTAERAYRQFGSRLHFSTSESHTRYFSFVARVGATPTATEQQGVRLLDRFGRPVAGYMRFKNNRFNCFMGSDSQQSVNPGQSGQLFDFDPSAAYVAEDRLMVMKLVTHPTDPDVLYLRAYRPSDPLTEPTATGLGTDTWHVFASDTTDQIVTGIEVSLVDTGLGFDEIRVGTTFESVTDPFSPLPAVLVSESAGSTAISEGGSTDTYTLTLATTPTADVTVSIAAGSQASVSPASLTFTSSNWSTPQTVTVTAVDDALTEGAHTATISHTVASADSDYNAITVVDIVAAIADNDFTPSLIPGLVGWYDAQTLSAADGTAITTWVDAVGGTNSTANNLTQVTGGVQPEGTNPVAPTLQTVNFNGYDYRALRFVEGAAGDYELLQAPGLVATGATARTIITVYQGGDSNGGRALGFGSQLIDNSNSRIHLNIANDLNGTLRFDGAFISSQSAALNWTDLFIRSTVMNSKTNFDEYIDVLDSGYSGTQVLSNGVPTNSLGNVVGDFFVGDVQRDNPGGQAATANFDILEVLVFDSALSTADRQAVQDYLKVKYTTDPNPLAAPAAPSGLTATTTSSTSIDLAWLDNSSGEDGFIVQQSTTSGGPWTDVATTAADVTSYTATPLAAGTNYYYQIIATSSTAGDSLPSTEASATTWTFAEAWRDQHFGSIANSGNAADTADPDGDGLVNLLERAFGTDPLSGSDVAGLSINIAATGYELTFPRARAELIYRIQTSTDLGQTDPWTIISTNPGSVGGTVTYLHVTVDPRRFYRLEVSE